MDILKIRKIFNRYLDHKGTPAEISSINKWYDQLDEESPIILDHKKEQQVKIEIWASLKPALDTDGAKVKQLRFPWIKVAASVLLIVSAGLIFRKFSTPEKPQARFADAYSTISTKTGERKQVGLPDGSVIILNSGSTVRIADNFSSNRKVTIVDGEAYFDVKHNTKHPFIIQSGPLTTQVLGTSFNIRAYSGLGKLFVGVTSGRVGIMLKNKATQYLTNNQQLVFDKARAQFLISPLDKQSLAWQQGNMVLNDASFTEMAFLMNKNYGLHICTSEKAVQSRHFTTVLSLSMSAVKALEVITAIHHLKIKQRRDTIEIFR